MTIDYPEHTQDSEAFHPDHCVLSMLDCPQKRPVTSLTLAGKAGPYHGALEPFSLAMTLFSENDNVLPLKIRHFKKNF